MRIKVFYAWQSDIFDKLNHRFIHKAIEAAVEKLNAEAIIDGADIEEAESFEIDHDTKGVPGSPPIAETICKKIDACAVFISDLTTVAKFRRKADGKYKTVQNPNVLIELGYARARKGVGRLIQIQNLAFSRLKDLPFDLQHLRKPIGYTLSDPNDPNKKSVLNKLTADLVVAIRSIVTTEMAEEATAEKRKMDEDDKAAETTAAAKREAVENSVAAGKYKVFEYPRAIVLSLIPLRPTKRFDTPKDLRASLMLTMRPINFTTWTEEPYSGSFVAQCYSSTERKAEGMLEITNEGSAFVMLNLGTAAFRGPDTRVGISILFQEIEFYKVAPTIVSALRRMGVRGPLLIGVSLIGAKDCLLHPPDSKYWRDKIGRPLEHGRIAHDFIRLEEGEAFGDQVEVTSMLRPGFEHFWMDAGYSHDPLFWDGKYIGVQ